MTLGEMKSLVMFQFNQDQQDIGDFTPFIGAYINDGYDRFVRAWADGKHAGNIDFPLLEADGDVPRIPKRFHRYIADWATWLLYRNGNQQKQQRGYEYRNSFLQAVADMLSEGGQAGDISMDEDGDGLNDETGAQVPSQPYRQFYNIPD